MSQLEKRLNAFINAPVPKWDDLVTLMKQLGYQKIEGEGSRVLL